MYHPEQNRRRIEDLVTSVCAAVLALPLLAGCASAGYQKGDVASVSMQQAATEVQVEGRAMDNTMACLSALIDSTGDLRPPYKRYVRSLDHFVSTAERTENTGRRMQEKNAQYFQAWDQQLQSIDYEHIRELSEARKAEVTNRVEAVTHRYQESQAAVQPLITYLQDIRKALNADLTPGGLESLKGIVKNANDNAAKVQVALEALTAELTNSSARMASVVTQPPQNTQ
jgi:hypothetical protein